MSHAMRFWAHEQGYPTQWEMVRDKQDLSGDLRSDVAYVIDGVVDMGSTSIIVPEGGGLFGITERPS